MSQFPILGQSPVEVFDHAVDGGTFQKIPAIYAIEVTAACDLQCPMCLRTTHMGNKKPKLLDIGLLDEMHKRGDFQGSTYIELQMAGEPTIHPLLNDIIWFLQQEVGVLVGMSTHGLNMKKKGRNSPNPSIAHDLFSLDCLTISIDSVDPAIYAKMRTPATLDNLLDNLTHFFSVLETLSIHPHKPFVELQLVRTSLAPGSGDVTALQELMEEKGWYKYASIRTTNDCFTEMSGRVDEGVNTRNSTLCLQPWLAVNVTQDGDVVSCCYIFDTNKQEVNYYGNLWEQSLEEIWNSSRVAFMRETHKQDRLMDQCAKCYFKSPSLIHQNIVSRLVRSKRRG